MQRFLHKAAWALLVTPVCALAFESVDVLVPASGGLYPAYPADTLGGPGEPYALWAQAGLMYDTNILRLTNRDSKEWVSRLGIGGRYDQRIIGRQAVHLEGSVDGYVYDKFSALDNVAYAGLGEWRWEAGDDLAGTFGVLRRRFQASLSQIQAAVYDPVTETDYAATARYALGPHLAARGGLTFVDYERPSHPFANTKTATATGGIEYVTDVGNAIGVQVAEAKGNAPVDQLVDPLGIFVNNDFRQRDAGIVGTWGALPSVRVAGRVGRTERHYTELPNRDFNGPTWDVTAQWYPTTKTTLVAEAHQRIASVIEIASSHIRAKGFSFGPSWAPTAKLNFQARFLREHQIFEGDPSAALDVGPVREEIVRGVRFGVYWEYTRSIHYQFSFDHGGRESNILGRDYRYSAAVAQVRVVF
jgi:hypothetical protein